jgi:hypothetical protein
MPEEAEALQAQGLRSRSWWAHGRRHCRLHALGEQLGRRIRVHVNLDSGMGARGLLLQETAAIAEMRKLVDLFWHRDRRSDDTFPLCGRGGSHATTLVTFRDFMQAVQTLKQELPGVSVGAGALCFLGDGTTQS